MSFETQEISVSNENKHFVAKRLFKWGDILKGAIQVC